MINLFFFCNTDDLVRAQTIQLLLVDQQVYPDVKLLCDIYKSRVTLAHMKHNVDFIQLLLDQTNEPLLISSQSKQEQAIIMDRLRDLTL